jgi:UDP-N-acetyl-2-amino-2-deoxyglucuronate dehydrogenase
MVKFGIIGLGHIGKRHAQHILKQEAASLVAVCDIDNTVATYLETIGYQDIPFYTDLSAFFGNNDFDVVCICTPNYLHCEHAILTLNHKVHAVVEKPMALSVKECNEMMAAAEENKKLIFAVKQNRYNPPVAAVKESIDAGRLGKIIMVQVNCFWNRDANYYAQSAWRGTKSKDGGCLFTQFSHFIDILYYLNGDILTAKGQIANYLHLQNTEFEDTGSFVMKAANGAIVNFNFTTCSFQQNMEGSITIFGEKGTVKIGGQYLNTIEYQKIENAVLPDIAIVEKANNYGLYQGSMSNHDKMIQNVIDVLINNEKMTTTALEGKGVIAIIEKMYQSVN